MSEQVYYSFKIFRCLELQVIEFWAMSAKLYFTILATVLYNLAPDKIFFIFIRHFQIFNICTARNHTILYTYYCLTFYETNQLKSIKRSFTEVLSPIIVFLNYRRGDLLLIRLDMLNCVVKQNIFTILMSASTLFTIHFIWQEGLFSVFFDLQPSKFSEIYVIL